MLTQTQRNAIFIGITTDYTIDGVDFVAQKTYREHWAGELATPVICLEYVKDGVKHISSVGRTSQLDDTHLAIDAYATTYDNTVHGSKIVREIISSIVDWFNTTSLDSVGVSVLHTEPAVTLHELEEGIYRIRFVVKLLSESI